MVYCASLAVIASQSLLRKNEALLQWRHPKLRVSAVSSTRGTPQQCQRCDLRDSETKIRRRASALVSPVGIFRGPPPRQLVRATGAGTGSSSAVTPGASSSSSAVGGGSAHGRSSPARVDETARLVMGDMVQPTSATAFQRDDWLARRHRGQRREVMSWPRLHASY